MWLKYALFTDQSIKQSLHYFGGMGITTPLPLPPLITVDNELA